MNSSENINKIDIYADGNLGLWVLEQIDPENVGVLFTTDHAVYEKAAEKQFSVSFENPNQIQFSNSRVALSIHYHKILKKELLDRYQKAYNIHPGYLPWGRGYYPIFWSLWERTPAGATIHEMTEGVDEGPIVEQIRVDYSDYESGYSLFLKVQEVEKILFQKYYPFILNQKQIPSLKQKGQGSCHNLRDFLKLKESAEWSSLSSEQLIRLVRCLTFPGYSGLIVTINGKQYELQLTPMQK
jgi:methionyl-tRNA formyltransferase